MVAQNIVDLKKAKQQLLVRVVRGECEVQGTHTKLQI